MEQEKSWALKQKISIAEKRPELAEQLDETDASLSLALVKKHSYLTQLREEVGALFGTPRLREMEVDGPEAPVKVISYMGSATDKIGADGDFYVDELTNMLYGPKTDGAWPEQGVNVDGPVVCKRTFLQISSGRRTRRSTSFAAFLRRLSSSLRSRRAA